MDNHFSTVNITFKRYDKPDLETFTTELTLNSKSNSDDVRHKIDELLQLTDCDNKIYKLRTHDGVLVTFLALLENNNEDEQFVLEVTKIHQNLLPKSRTHLYDAYVHAVRSRIQAMNNRVENIESLIPEIRLRRHALAERTVHSLSTKVTFLNRRLDELTPNQWKTGTAVL